MRLILKNFLCYESREFEFDDSGIILISGPSGIGKTTILKAIYFALYGYGTKVVMFGKTNCKVELYYGDLHITRTKKPRRLLVNEYEDDVAQSIIDEKFGKSFDVIGYMQQGAYNSFINMSATDKLVFLENFAFKDINLENIKKKTKSLIKKNNDALVETRGKKEVTEEIIKKIGKPDKIKFPLKIPRDVNTSDQDSLNKLIELEKNKLRDIIPRLKSFENKLRDLKQYSYQSTSLEKRIVNIDERIQKLMFEASEFSLANHQKLEIDKKALQYLVSKRTYLNLHNQYTTDKTLLENMKIDEETEYKRYLENTKKQLWTEYTQHDSDSTIEEYTDIEIDIKNYGKYKSDLEKNIVDEKQYLETESKIKNIHGLIIEYRKKYDIIQSQKNTYNCPSCDVSLKLIKDKLCLVEKYEIDLNEEKKLLESISTSTKQIKSFDTIIKEYDIKREISKGIEKNIKNICLKYDDNFPETYKDVSDDLIYMKKYKQENINREESIKNIESKIKNKVYSSSLMSLDKKVKEMKKKLDLLDVSDEKKYTDIRYTEDELNIIIKKNESDILNKKNIDIRINELLTDKKTSKYEIEDIKQKCMELEVDYDDISNFIVQLTENIDKINTEKIQLEKTVEKIKEYEDMKKKFSEHKEWNIRLSQLNKDEKVQVKRLDASKLLFDKITESENIAMSYIINSINAYAHTYLELFFEDNSMVAQLTAFKESKKIIKPHITLNIYYKNMEMDINMVSGGEKDRIILAFMLALSDIVNNKFIILDECTSSLDSELTIKIYDTIKEHCNDKLVLVVCHQITTGSFDKIISLK